MLSGTTITRGAANVAIAVLGLATVLASTTAADDSPNPMNYQGKSVSRWAAEMRGEDDEARKAAADALVAIGEPYVREMLREVDNSKLRGRAIRVAGRLGVTAKDALPELIECLSAEENFIRGWGSDAIGSMGPDAEAAVPAIVESFKTWDDSSKGHGYSALAAIGPAAREASAELRRLASEEQDQNIRSYAVRTLEIIENKPSQ